jgi:hypothetical protein
VSEDPNPYVSYDTSLTRHDGCSPYQHKYMFTSKPEYTYSTSSVSVNLIASEFSLLW